jgi:alanyl-tRNA synthetase
LDGVPATKFIGYENITSEKSKLIKDFEVDGQRILIFDQSPFYAES